MYIPAACWLGLLLFLAGWVLLGFFVWVFCLFLCLKGSTYKMNSFNTSFSINLPTFSLLYNKFYVKENENFRLCYGLVCNINVFYYNLFVS